MACDIGRIIPRWLLSTFNFIILVGRSIEVIHVVNWKQENKSLLLSVENFKCSLKWQTTCSGKTLDTSTVRNNKAIIFVCLRTFKIFSADIHIPAGAGLRAAGLRARTHEGGWYLVLADSAQIDFSWNILFLAF